VFYFSILFCAFCSLAGVRLLKGLSEAPTNRFKKGGVPMVKPILFSLLILPLFVACGKQEPPVPAVPPTPQTSVPAPAPAPEAAAPALQVAPSVAAPAAPAAGGGNVAKGEATYKQTCFACHAAGVAGAPKLGDMAAWGPRIAQGNETLYTHSIKGFQGKAGMMPPKGGNMSLSDADVKAAVDYMVGQSK
jgi:cytochrome c5